MKLSKGWNVFSIHEDIVQSSAYETTYVFVVEFEEEERQHTTLWHSRLNLPIYGVAEFVDCIGFSALGKPEYKFHQCQLGVFRKNYLLVVLWGRKNSESHLCSVEVHYDRPSQEICSEWIR